MTKNSAISTAIRDDAYRQVAERELEMAEFRERGRQAGAVILERTREVNRKLVIAAIRKGYCCNELALTDEEHTQNLGEGVLAALDAAGFKVVAK